MLKNKKKLRRLERRNGLVKATQSLVLAGALLVGGIGPALAADNLSINESAALSRIGADDKAGIIGGDVNAPTTGNTTINALKVSGGTLYVGNTGAGYTVTGGHVDGAPNNANAWVTGGKLVVGQTYDGTQGVPVLFSKLTVDNMLIAGGTVEVNNMSTLDSKGDININGGTLTLNAGTVIADDNTANQRAVNVNTGGTLEAVGGVLNFVKASALNLHGGTIRVETGAALTYGATVAAAPTAVTGTLEVVGTDTLNSKGGTIAANVTQKGGLINYTGGTTTITGAVDVKDGFSEISGGAKVTATSFAINSTSGLLSVSGSNTISSAVSANVPNALKIGGSTLTIDGTLKAVAGSITVWSTGTLIFGRGEIDITDGKTPNIANGAITISGGTVEVTGFVAKAYTQSELQDVLANYGWKAAAAGAPDQFAFGANDKLSGVNTAVFHTNSYDGNTVILKGVTISDITNKNISGTQSASAPEQLTVTTGSISGATTVVTVPSLAATGGTLTNSATMHLDGSVANVGAGKLTDLATFTTTGTTIVNSGATLKTTTFTQNAGVTTIDSGATLNNTTSTALNGTLIPVILNVLSSTASLGALTTTGATAGDVTINIAGGGSVKADSITAAAGPPSLSATQPARVP